MLETWRWFGPQDKVTLPAIRQAGATGVVTALYHLLPGEVWPIDAIAERQRLIQTREDDTATGLHWAVVESLPVSEHIKVNGALAATHIEHYKQSLRHLAAQGIEVICYNFMPILDWTRTDLAAEQSTGALALRFDLVDFAVFDIHLLQRDNAHIDYPADVVQQAEQRAATLQASEQQALIDNVLAGLPGSMEVWTLETVRAHLATYQSIDADQLRENMQRFLREVVPLAEELGLRLCCHPDDPPWPLLGLPRIMSSEADYRWLVDAVPSPANGITFCTGSLGAHGDNDLVGMLQRLGEHVHFLHLRNVQREQDHSPGSFHEAEHLDGSTDMVAVIKTAVAEEQRRKQQGRSDWRIPMRPDHGQVILADPSAESAPGYSAIGRLKGLAELRGVARAFESLGDQL